MSWLFLAVALWGAAFTWNALNPRWKGARLSTLSFAAGWLTTELAIHHVAWQAIATVAFAFAGAFSGDGAWPGWLGLGITVVSWGGLLYCQLQASRARTAVDAALRQTFGDGYFTEIQESLRPALSDAVDWRRVLQPFPIRRRGVERIKNVQFGRGGGLDLHLDIYRSASQPEDCPVLFQIHGGAWIMGSKDEQALPLMNQLASMGWVCVSVNYRLSPHATFPEHLIDCKRALHWVKENIADYGGDPGFIAVTGGSAGGHLCALMGLTQNDPEYQPGFEGADTNVACCVPYYGVYDFTNRNETLHHDGLVDVLERRIIKGSQEEMPEAWDRASPISRVTDEAPPFFIVHGSHDTLVPVGEAREFERVLAEKSRHKPAYAEIPGAQHAFELFPSLRTEHVNNGVCRFLALAYSRYLGEAVGLEHEDAVDPAIAAAATS